MKVKPILVLLLLLLTPISALAYPSDKDVMYLATDYSKSHVYIENVYDCSEMSQDFWNMCTARGWHAMIGAKHDKIHHAWVVVETGKDSWIAADPTGGFIVYPDQNMNFGDIKLKGSWFYNAKWYEDPMKFRKGEGGIGCFAFLHPCTDLTPSTFNLSVE